MARAERENDCDLSSRTIRLYLIANLVAVVVTAYFSVTFFHPDEQYQVLEYVGHKLGRTAAAELYWEHQDRMRAWLQPATYYAICRAAEFLGIRDAFVEAFVLRLASGLLAWVSLGRMVQTSLRWCGDGATRLAQLRVLTLVGFLPYLFVRTSSENVSCSLVTLGFCLVLDACRRDASLPAGVAFVAGALFGLAFECRFATAILIAGLIAWLCVFRRVRLLRGWLALAGGGAVALLLGLLVDHWGYGEWCFPAYHYVRRNLMDRVASSQFGIDPFYGYLYLLPTNIFAPVVLVLMTSLVLTWLRRPRHPLTWVTLPYALVHSVLAHKEERFFFPMVVIASASVVLGLSPAQRAGALLSPFDAVARRADAIARRIWGLRHSGLAAVVAANSTFSMLLLAIYPLGWHAHLPFYEYVYRHPGIEAHIWKTEGWNLPEYPFYRRRPWNVTVADASDLARAVQAGEAVYFVTRLPYETIDTAELGATARLLTSEFPGWQHASVRAVAGPALRWLSQTLDAIPRAPRATGLSVYRITPAGEPSDPKGLH